MKKSKLLKTLTEFFEKEERKKRKHHAELEKLLKKLQDKESRLEDELQKEKSEKKRKRLSEELQIVKAQHAKGTKTLLELETP